MTASSTPLNESLTIKENESFTIADFQVEVLSYLGLLTSDVHYFKVNIRSTQDNTVTDQLALLRVGSLESGLKRELDLRQVLGNYGMIANILAETTANSVLINPLPSVQQPEPLNEVSADSSIPPDGTTINQSEPEQLEPIQPSSTPQADEGETGALENSVTEESEPEYLEEEYYPEKDITDDESSLQKLIILTDFPQEDSTLWYWLQKIHSKEEYLSLAIQICQLFSYSYQRNWCFINLIPHLIQIGKPLKFFDLTSAYPVGQPLPSGLIDNYHAPELVLGKPPDELMSSYTIGAFLYQAIHQKLPQNNYEIELQIERIPRIYQILKICLSPIPEERFPLSQLLSLLIDTRNLFNTYKVYWNIASNSTIGLSPNRLQNEDNYGVRQQQISNEETLIMGVIADGMGGMAQGEVASKIAIQVALQETIPSAFKTDEQRANWLVSLCQKANQSINDTVRDGGTTLSLVLAINDKLMVAHIGDSRIYLLRQNSLQQLSEDHSLVAMLVAGGQITQEESLAHPDRNVLTKSLGGKNRLSEGYVQDLRRTSDRLVMTLENDDILLLCSDGVWDIVSNSELQEIFTNFDTLQAAVDTTIDRVMERGAPDNATLLALQCHITSAK